MGFMIKDAAKITLTPLVGEGSPIVIDYLNTFNVKTESEKIAAKANGIERIVVYSSKTGTFELGSDILTKDHLAMILGGTLSGTKITVSNKTATPYFSMNGVFTITNDDGSEEVQELTAPKVAAQPNADFSMSATEVSTFTLIMDILADATGKMFEMDKKTA